MLSKVHLETRLSKESLYNYQMNCKGQFRAILRYHYRQHLQVYYCIYKKPLARYVVRQIVEFTAYHPANSKVLNNSPMSIIVPVFYDIKMNGQR